MIDILMAVYNGEKYISEQIDSIIKQSYTDWKLIIHDDGSNDDTVKIVEKYIEKYPDKISYINDGIKTGGAKNNFFHLMKYSKNEYIMLADQDDIWEKEKIEKAYKSITEKEKVHGKDMPILCHSDLKVVTSDLKVINNSFFDMQKLDSKKNNLNDLLVQNNITGCTVIFNKATKILCTAMPSDAIMHDWWLGLVVAAFGKVYFMNTKEILYRQHENNTEGAKNMKSPCYLLKKVFDTKNIKKSLNKTYNQARCLYELYSNQLSEDNKKIIEAYISIKDAKKTDKIRIIKKYGFMKSGFLRKISYILIV